MKKIFLVLAGFVLLSGVLGGCGGGRINPPTDADRGFIYGYLNTPNGSPDKIYLFKKGEAYVPPFHPFPKVTVNDDGRFFAENMEPGDYYLYNFQLGRTMYRVTTPENAHYLTLRPGKMLYMGSFEVGKEVSGDMFASGEIRFTPGSPANRGPNSS